MSVFGINALVHVAQLKADVSNQQALGDAEGQRQALRHGYGLDDLLSSPSVLTDLRSSNPGAPTQLDVLHAAAAPRASSLHDDLAGGNSAVGDIAAVLIEYQKLAHKEAREDRKDARDDRASALASMADKLSEDNEAIQHALSAAAETYANEMDQAASQLVTGVAGGMLQLGNGTASTAMAGKLESSPEYFIGLGARLSQGDVRKDLDALKERLAELKAAEQSLVAAPHTSHTSGNSNTVARIEVEIKEILSQIQALQAAEQDAKDAATAQGDANPIGAQLEKSAQAYKDLLDAMRP